MKGTVIKVFCFLLLYFVVDSAYGQDSCAGVGDCAYFQCLVQQSEKICGDVTLQESPVRQAFYFCTKIQDAEVEFDLQVFSDFEQNGKRGSSSWAN